MENNEMKNKIAWVTIKTIEDSDTTLTNEQIKEKLINLYGEEETHKMEIMATAHAKKLLKERFEEYFNFPDNDDIIVYINNNIIDAYMGVGNPYKSYVDCENYVWDLIYNELVEYFNPKYSIDESYFRDLFVNADLEFLNIVLHEYVHCLKWQENECLANEIMENVIKPNKLDEDWYFGKTNDNTPKEVEKNFNIKRLAMVTIKSTNLVYVIINTKNYNSMGVEVVETTSPMGLQEYGFSEEECVKIGNLGIGETFTSEDYGNGCVVTRMA